MRGRVISLVSAASGLALGAGVLVWHTSDPGRDEPMPTPVTSAAAPSPPTDLVPEVLVEERPVAPAAPSRHQWTPEQAELYGLGDPVGTASVIGLRFVRSLQRQDHWSAAAELGLVGRAYFANRSAAELTRVMEDVFSNAGLHHAAPCTSAEQLNKEAVVVRCGGLRVVVHVSDGITGRGVRLARWHVNHDRYVGPHTHAVTTWDLR